MNTNVIRNLSGSVEVDDIAYGWTLRQEAVWTRGEGWTGLTIAVRLDGALTREAILEFPYLPGGNRNRPRLQSGYVRAAIGAALRAGWDPRSKGKPVHFDLDRGDLP